MKMMKLNKKKLLLFAGIPAVIVLVVTLFFFGGAFHFKETPEPKSQGLNTKLPTPAGESKNPLDKLSIYQQADKDSAEKAQLLSRDPFFRKLQDTAYAGTNYSSSGYRPGVLHSSSPWQTTQTNNERILEQKLKQLQQQLDNNTASLSNRQPDRVALNNLPSEYPKLPARYAEPTTPDPELAQIDSMLSKIMAIQHPERVAGKFDGPLTRDDVKPFYVSNRHGGDSLLWPTNVNDQSFQVSISSRNRFYELDEIAIEDTANVVAATVYGTQEVTSGMTVSIRLDQDIFLANETIPAGTLVWGEGQLAQDRFIVAVKNIAYRNSFFPVNMEVFSLDGFPGIPIAGAMSQQAAKQGMDRGVQSLQLASLNPSLAAQATSAGIESAKSFLSKKARLIKITLKDGHPVLLRNTIKGK